MNWIANLFARAQHTGMAINNRRGHQIGPGRKSVLSRYARRTASLGPSHIETTSYWTNRKTGETLPRQRRVLTVVWP
jgi:hypothetical protein